MNSAETAALRTVLGAASAKNKVLGTNGAQNEQSRADRQRLT